jgi:hypothetical protein
MRAAREIVSELANDKPVIDVKHFATIIEDKCNIKKTLELIDKRIESTEKTIGVTPSIAIDVVANSMIALMKEIKSALKGGE